jgi:hypothetical protein
MQRVKPVVTAWLRATPAVAVVWGAAGLVAGSTQAVIVAKREGATLVTCAVPAAQGAMFGAGAGAAIGCFFWLTIPIMPIWVIAFGLTDAHAYRDD